ncbi:unnamed protein product [Cladocopium goreaui]|uniref:Uncharacterized protein n=1 Tax=Cladocopium goreaui TaxID=2562237 RepID=A0A9P1GSV3_9DINO|nr:unnamed protein product [Cladocopium goreaui]
MGDSSSKPWMYDQEDMTTPSTRYSKDSLTCSPWSDDSDVTPVWRPCSETDTVIIFDWDDTLLCSSAINAQQWRQDQLEQLESMVESILETAMQLGETMIVTNGNSSWVQDSARRFLPNLSKILSRVKVMSARAVYEQSFPGDPFAWKRQAFKEILARRRQEGYHPDGVNLIVLGDSPAEIQAAKSATKVLNGRSVIKTVKFKEAPSVNELLGQLRRVGKPEEKLEEIWLCQNSRYTWKKMIYVVQELSTIVQEDRSLSRGLVQRTFPVRKRGRREEAGRGVFQICQRQIGSLVIFDVFFT